MQNIDVGPDGTIWVARNDDAIWSMEWTQSMSNASWEQLSDVFGVDVAVGADGTLYHVGTDQRVYSQAHGVETVALGMDDAQCIAVGFDRRLLLNV